VHLPLGEEDPTLDAGEGVVLRAATAVIVTSGWTARRVIARHGVDGAHVHVAPPGVDPAPRAPGTDGVHRLLCLGAVTPTKGQDLLVAALADLAHHPWRADLVGPVSRDPAFVAALRARIADHGLADRLVITGPRTGAALEATFAAADLLVVPSRIETSGMAAAEALARGIPVLATDVGGLPETLDGAGLLIPAEDIATLGAALQGWFAQPSRRLGLRLSATSRRGTLPGWAATAGHVDRVLRHLA
jgi:glycosyltransferase involved in cell wall biosynthesis